MEDLLEALGLDQLLEDRHLALGRKDDLLVAALNALLQPALLLRIGDVHVLHADRAAVGAADDGEDLAQGRGLQTQHVVEEDRAVVVGLGEAVGRRVQLAGVTRRHGNAERVEVGPQMAAHPVVPDHHDGAQGIQRGGADIGGRRGGRAGLDGLAQLGLDRRPQTVEGRQPVRPRGGRWIAGPGGFGGGGPDGVVAVGQRGEEGLPGRIDRGRIFRPAGVEVFHESGIAAVQEGGFGQNLIDDACVVRHRSRAFSPRGQGCVSAGVYSLC